MLQPSGLPAQGHCRPHMHSPSCHIDCLWDQLRLPQMPCITHELQAQPARSLCFLTLCLGLLLSRLSGLFTSPCTPSPCTAQHPRSCSRRVRDAVPFTTPLTLQGSAHIHYLADIWAELALRSSVLSEMRCYLRCPASPCLGSNLIRLQVWLSHLSLERLKVRVVSSAFVA